MKKIYIVLTYTGAVLSKIISTYTQYKYSHVSISLDIELNQMYSYGRYNAYNPFWGGFVQEYTYKGTFKRFYKTQAKVYSLEVTNEQYEIIKNEINKIKNANPKSRFNMLGLMAAGLNKNIKRKHAFYCAEFLKYLFEKAQIQTNLPEVVKPRDFENLEGLEKIYEGKIKDYKVSKININLKKKQQALI